MGKFSLATYAVRVREKRTTSLLPLDGFGPGYDLFQIFDDYLSGLTVRLSHSSAERRLIRVSTLSRDKGKREIEGIIETGEYGFESDFFDVKEQKASYRRKISDAEMLPFYFLLSLPKGRDEGLLVLQRFRNFGIRKVLLEDFLRFFTELNTDYVVNMSPLIPEAVIKSWIDQGKVSTIKFVQFQVKSDIADAFDINNHEEVSSELTFHARRGSGVGVLSGLSERYFGRKIQNRVVEIRGGNYEFDTVKLEVQIGNSKRTVDVLHPGRARAFHDITDEVELDKSGHPKLASLSEQAHRLLGDHFAGLGLKE